MDSGKSGKGKGKTTSAEETAVLPAALSTPTKTPIVSVSNSEQTWIDKYSMREFAEKFATEAYDYDLSQLEDVAEKCMYTGFDMNLLFEKYKDILIENKKLYYNSLVIFGTRGTRIAKIRKNSGEEMQKLLDLIVNKFNLQNLPANQLKPDTLTPSRLCMLSPENTMFAMKKIKQGILYEFPWYFRHSAVNSLIHSTSTVHVDAAYFVSFFLSTKVNMSKNEAIARAIKYVDIAVKNDFVSPLRRDKFWHVVKAEQPRYESVLRTYSERWHAVAKGNVDYEKKMQERSLRLA